MADFTVAQGRILKDGEAFRVLGVNYHPSAVGCRIWTDWRPEDLRRDFRSMAEDGLNTVRLFLFWRDAQPAPGTVSAVILDRLEAAVSAAEDAGLACVVSLFTIWMNGQLLDLPWRRGRDLWRDGELLAAQELLGREVARALRGHGNVLGFDLGDELWNIDPDAALRLDRAEVAAWQGRLVETIHKEWPEALVMQANDASGVFSPAPYGVDNAAELDLIATHGFPSWAPGSIESTMSFKATNLVPFLVRLGAAFGVPLVDELGSYGTDEATRAAYLRGTAASALGNGASGLIVWSWQDIVSCDEPYDLRPMERFTGLRRADGSSRPSLKAFQKAFAVPAVPVSRTSAAPIALYLPEQVRGTGQSYLDGQGSTLATFFSYLLLKRAHLEFDVVAGETVGRSLVICPSPTRLTLVDIERLTRSARAGATVYLSLGDHLHGFAGPDLVGAEIVDFDAGARGKSALFWHGREWPLDWNATRTVPTTMRAVASHVLARYPDDSPALVTKRIGKGCVVFTNSPFEAQIDGVGRLASADWPAFYRALADLSGVKPPIECTDPDVEVLSYGGQRALVVNHGASPSQVELVRGGVRRAVDLAEKNWTVVEFPT
jgi:hypothetical protein